MTNRDRFVLQRTAELFDSAVRQIDMLVAWLGGDEEDGLWFTSHNSTYDIALEHFDLGAPTLQECLKERMFEQDLSQKDVVWRKIRTIRNFRLKN